MNKKNLSQFIHLFLIGSLSCLTFPALTAEQDPLLEQVLAGPQRLPANVSRDKYRHPQETLQFFGIKQDMQVIEILPGGGWYTEILAPYLSENGKLIGASYGANNSRQFLSGIHARFMDKIKGEPTVYGKVEVIDFQTSPGYLNTVADNSADMILDFRNTHNFIRWFGGAEEVYQSYYRVLKPGGVLGIVEHRAHAGSQAEEVANTGYTPEQYSIDLANQAGLELVEKSEINANPKDTKDHPNGVWTLPPGNRSGDADGSKYTAIGESDRMTLKFIKPLK